MGAKLKHKYKNFVNYRQLRINLGMTQAEFWGKVGMTQSAGSRYENQNRVMHGTVKELVRLVHVEGIDLDKVNRVDLSIVDTIKSLHPDIYSNLKKYVTSKNKNCGY